VRGLCGSHGRTMAELRLLACMQYRCQAGPLQAGEEYHLQGSACGGSHLLLPLSSNMCCLRGTSDGTEGTLIAPADSTFQHLLAYQSTAWHLELPRGCSSA
jgi:hypothetical protein